eukprot:11637164-Alexandrium_andersonii.AAC.1
MCIRDSQNIEAAAGAPDAQMFCRRAPRDSMFATPKIEFHFGGPYACSPPFRGWERLGPP